MKKITHLFTSLVFITLLLNTSSLQAQTSQDVIDDLIEFAVLTDGANWYNPWPIDFSQNPPVPLSDACGWYGVSCNDTKDAIWEISLDSLGLSGNLPPFCSFLSNPGSLISLNLRKNNLTGSLPDISCLSSLKTMKLDTNSLTGQLDPALATLPLLSFLIMSGNQFVGDIPVFPNKSNVTINLSDNNLTSLPAEWTVFRRDISHNRLNFDDLLIPTCDVESPINACSPQKPIPLTRQGNTLSAEAAGGNVAQITYVWTNEGTGTSTTLVGTELYTVPDTGSYHVVASIGNKTLSSESMTIACPPTNIAYVNGQATGNNDGTSWADAFTDLQAALALTDICSDITEIWVAAGTYYPTSGTDRNISFTMKNNLAIYGGFDGTETQLSQRNWAANVTTLSGDIGIQGVESDNSLHVVNNNGNGLNSTAVLDGFIVKKGYAHGSATAGQGGGMFNKNSSPKVINCSFNDNSASSFGGGMFNLSTSSIISNCTFSGNSAPSGGGMVNLLSFVSVTNCLFNANLGGTNGTGMLNGSYSFSIVTNCTFSYNSGSGLYDSFSSSTVTNCIFWGNSSEIGSYSGTPVVTYSIVQGGYEGLGNVDTDPLFVDAAGGDFRLKQCSPAIDMGNDNAPGLNGISTDLDGNVRFFDAIQSITANVDMGAYEYQSLLPAPIAACKDITVELLTANPITITANEIDNGSSGGCSALSLLINNAVSVDFDCDDLGNNPVTLTVTDGSGNTSTCTANVTVEDNIALQIATSCPDNITLCGAQNVSWTPPTATDNCAVVTYTSNYDTGDYFDVGTYVVSYTFYDAAGLSVNCNFTLSILPSPEVEIIQNNLPTWCQGVKTLSAKLDNSTEIQESLTYMWSNDLGSSAQVTVLANGSYSVTVTDDNGCSTEVTTEVNADLSTLLSAHTILSGEDMEMAESVVLSGGAGVQNAGEVTIQNNTDITTFLRAANAYIDGSSTVTNYINADSPLILPPFLSNPYYNNNDIYVPSGGSMTLSGSNYGNVKVGKNATLIINNGNMYLKSLSVNTAASIIFNQPTNMMIQKKLSIGLLGNINVGGPATVIYVSDNASVGQGSIIEVDIYAQEGLEVNDSGSDLITNMTGLFIGIDGVFSNDNVIWNWNADCGEMPANGANTPFIPPFSEGVKTNLPHINQVLNVYPNPTPGLLNIDVSDYLEQSVELVLYNVLGKTVWHKRISVLEKTLLNVNLTDLADGLYYLNLKTAGQQVSKQIVLQK